jgi:hypothetical protein
VPSAAPRGSAPSSSTKPSAHNTDDAPSNKKIIYQKSNAYEQRAQKRSSNLVKELLLPLALIGAIGALGWFGYKKFFTTNPSSSDISITTPPQDTVAATPPQQDTPKTIAPPAMSLVDSVEQALQKDSLALVAQQKIDSININKKDTVALVVKPKQQTSATLPAAKDTVKSTVKKVPPETHRKSIDKYISLSLNKIPKQGIKDIKLFVRNIGNEHMNVAVINVSYLNDKGAFIKNETLEADNIGVGKTVSVKIPEYKNAAKITYKTSLISGDSLYLMRK